MRIHLDRAEPPGALEKLPDGCWRAREEEQLVLRVTADEPAQATLAGDAVRIRAVTRAGTGFETSFDLQVRSWAGRALVVVSCGAQKRWCERGYSTGCPPTGASIPGVFNGCSPIRER